MHAVATSAVDHGQVVLAVGRRTADHPGLGVHGKEPRGCDIDVQREFGTQGGSPSEHPEALESAPARTRHPQRPSRSSRPASGERVATLRAMPAVFPVPALVFPLGRRRAWRPFVSTAPDAIGARVGSEVPQGLDSENSMA